MKKPKLCINNFRNVNILTPSRSYNKVKCIHLKSKSNKADPPFFGQQYNLQPINYLEYNSTISVGFTGTSITSLEGISTTLPVKFS